MWNRTRITALFGVKYPILLGPMGGGFSTPELLAAVSNAGGLGSFGAYTLTPQEIRETDKAIRQLTDQPYNFNLWVSDVDGRLKNYPMEALEKVKQRFKPYFDELSIPMPALSTDIPSKFENQVEVIFEIKPAVFSFIFGVPSPEILRECRRLNIKTVGAATTLDEALLLEEAGVDALVAAGFEGGGHRPSFLRPPQESFTGLFALLQQLKSHIRIPIIAAGGISDGKGIAAACCLGADAVQLGTAFVACEECNASDAHRAKLFSKEGRYTVVSKSLTGRMGRMIKNRIADEISLDHDILPFPLHTKLLMPLKKAALEQGRTDLVNFWSGQHKGFVHRKADELMTSLIKEASMLLKI
ncbi:nitronate monooxygenase [Olivibacter sp. CPCC 100613]|uniref:NAD(P)H-dependent flavin oxidoreductase n=1 Tax=Olivibacter sp. CPCC 100613 TaxID=3079931 RepID=UPI002FF6951E